MSSSGPRSVNAVIAQRMAGFRASGIRRMFELGRSLPDPIDLSIGQPDFDVPEPIKAAAIQAIQEGHNRYTVTQGIPELNERILEMVRERYDYAAEASLVTSGVSGGLLLTFLVLIDPGDEVLIPDPYFLMYKNLVTLCGGVPRYYDLYPDFQITRDRIADALTERTKILLLNSPSNPTGIMARPEELEAIARLAHDNDIVVVSDEIYDRFVYDEDPGHHSIAEFHPESLLLSGFSKSYGMPGWRLGYAVGPKEILNAMQTLQQFSFVCAPSMVQLAGLVALDTDISDLVDAYRRKRQMVVDGLTGRFAFAPPNGSFYAFLQVPDGSTATAFAERAIQRGLLIVPGSACSERDTHFRISFAVSDRMLERGIEALNQLAGS